MSYLRKLSSIKLSWLKHTFLCFWPENFNSEEWVAGVCHLGPDYWWLDPDTDKALYPVVLPPERTYPGVHMWYKYDATTDGERTSSVKCLSLMLFCLGYFCTIRILEPVCRTLDLCLKDLDFVWPCITLGLWLQVGSVLKLQNNNTDNQICFLIRQIKRQFVKPLENRGPHRRKPVVSMVIRR